jgi:nitrogen-specific signal transduction histidine kinase
MNLMVNAIEAMRERGGELTHPHRASRERDQGVGERYGVGIPADQMEHIFSAFVTTKASGTGMGLAISRTIVESHDGKIWAEANSGPGATFHFTLPAASDPAIAPRFVKARLDHFDPVHRFVKGSTTMQSCRQTLMRCGDARFLTQGSG